MGYQFQVSAKGLANTGVPKQVANDIFETISKDGIIHQIIILYNLVLCV